MKIRKTNIYVEGKTDSLIIDSFMRKIGLSENISSIVMKGKLNVLKMARKYKENDDEICIFLIDSDVSHIPDARDYINNKYKFQTKYLFCAIPEIESWLLSDNNLIDKIIRFNFQIKDEKFYFLHDEPIEKSRNFINVLPESIPYPKVITNNLLKRRINRDDWRELIVLNMDIQTAMSRSPSLRYFLSEISSLNYKDIPIDEQLNLTSAYFRDVISTLINETPAETVLWKTLDGPLTANKLIKEVKDGTHVGRLYISEVFRLARDIIRHRSN